MLDKALNLSEQLVAEHPNIPEYAVSSVFIRLRLSDSLWASDPTGAEDNLRKALDVQSTLVRRFPNWSNRFWKAAIQESLGRLYLKHDRLAEARTKLQDCIVSFKEVLDESDKPGFLRFILFQNYMKLADVLRGMGDDEAAKEATRQARAFKQR